MNRPAKRNRSSSRKSSQSSSSQGKRTTRLSYKAQQIDSVRNITPTARRHENLHNGRKLRGDDTSQGNDDDWSNYVAGNDDDYDNTDKNNEKGLCTSGDDNECDTTDMNDEDNLCSSGDENGHDNTNKNDETEPGTSTERSEPSTNTVSSRQMHLIKIYSEGNTLKQNDNTLRILTKNLRKYIIPQVKFVTSSKAFGSFEQPDFSDGNCWMNKLFDTIPTMKNATDTMKATVWMTCRSKLKEQFSLHRSNTTLKIKKRFTQGKNFECK